MACKTEKGRIGCGKKGEEKRPYALVIVLIIFVIVFAILWQIYTRLAGRLG